MHMDYELTQLEATIMAQRPRLVRLCARLTCESDAAEDLAQEALLEAWRHLHALREPKAQHAWLNGITRNVCLRWLRQQGRDHTHIISSGNPLVAEAVQQIPDVWDLEAELERGELATFLDQALAILPPQTREILIQKYINDSPQSEIAARLNISEGAVAMRLQRGKVALRHQVATVLHDEGPAYQPAGDRAVWRRTNTWCPHCGQQRLLMSSPTHDIPVFQLRCHACTSEAGAYFVNTRWQTPPPLPRSTRALTAYVLTWSNSFFRVRLREGTISCLRCEETIPLQPYLAGNDKPSPGVRIVGAHHKQCSSEQWAYSTELTLYLPEGQRFWQQHRRIRALPEREVEHAGQTALLTRFERIDGTARLEVLSKLPTYEVIHVYETAGA